MTPATAVLVACWALLGLLIGIGLNRIIFNLPRDLPVFARPRCTSCEAPIPGLGRPTGGACRNCGEPTRYDHVEYVLAALFALVAYFRSGSEGQGGEGGIGGPMLIYSLYMTVLVVIAAIDARHRYVYTIICYPAILLSLILSSTIPGNGILGPFLGFVSGWVAFRIFYEVGRLLYRGSEPMGTGDVTIAALIGAMVALPRVFPALVLGTVASAALGLLVMVAQRRGRQTFIPYGPGLCAGAVAAFFITP